MLALVSLRLLLLCCLPLVSLSVYQVPAEFMRLYLDFTGRPPSGDYEPTPLNISIATAVSSLMSREDDRDGKLVIATPHNFLIYGKDKQLLSKVDARASLSDGFFEMTAISHMGPAILYLSKMQQIIQPKDPSLSVEEGRRWREYVVSALQQLRHDCLAVLCYTQETDWIAEMNGNLGERVVWKGKDKHGTDIAHMAGSMVVFASELSVSFLDFLLEDPETRLIDQEALRERFFSKKPAGFNQVMIATFVLAAMNSLVGVLDALTVHLPSQKDWETGRFILQNLAGTVAPNGRVMGNVGAGLTAEKNPLYATLLTYAQRAGASRESVSRRVVIPAYANLFMDSPEKMSEEDWAYYNVMVWEKSVLRSVVVEESMPSSFFGLPWDDSLFRVEKKGVERYEELLGKRGARGDGSSQLSSSKERNVHGDAARWPGDFFPESEWSNFGGTVEALLSRVRHAFGDSTEMLSSGVAFWLGPALVQNGNRVEGMDIPGLSGVDYTAGEPLGLHASRECPVKGGRAHSSSSGQFQREHRDKKEQKHYLPVFE
uniref:DUF5624 domain-containing protein n=1 Tax=Chromera velia CCMP2878 TaxID=1169474 RepID=A0A0G4HBY9_9ALVE|eukprot:Cvel_930.t1-p1 / transcript=Cvel_930.t1 / gene=Cvel_930 / organism=Chromera_velia_CCMP2878 / gene_product=hypothetical protein / transcript_product=hypothetical protein / location=Cvel_scaffold29:133817-135445(-) / protein_length=543 / sequence_SO=supercontig / SO=protein_coding / is_pseudo=false